MQSAIRSDMAEWPRRPTNKTAAEPFPVEPRAILFGW